MNLFLPGDLKVFLPGAAGALAIGLLLGGAMQPHLDADDRPAGPQIIAAASGERSADTVDAGGLALAAYHGQVPDYVLGTDWKKTMAWPDERAATSSLSRGAEPDDAAPAEAPATFTRAAYDEPPLPHAYPSVSGGAGRSVHAATDADVATDDDTLPADQG